MEQHVYFDVLDTARTIIGGEVEGRAANECILMGQAELKMSILRGWTPVFPQTYGWDSAALLSYLAEGGLEGKSFRWLLTKGFVRVRLRNSPSIWDAALSAFQSPLYRQLAAWPEFNTDDPFEARRPIVEAMRTGNNPSALSLSVRNRLDLLRELSMAVAQAPPSATELPRGDKLRTLIERTSAVAQTIDEPTAGLLQRCTQLSDPNNRTAIYTLLDAEAKRDQAVARRVRNIADCCFNAVAAECVGAKRLGLTIPQSPDATSSTILLEALPGSHKTDIFESTTANPGPEDLVDLKPVTWRDITGLLEDKNKYDLTANELQAEAVKMIARVNVEGAGRYALRIEGLNFLSNAAIWGTSTFAAGVVFGYPGVAVAAIIMGLAGGLGSLDARADLKKVYSAKLVRKWRGFFQHNEQGY